jgi:hypothetical protein
MSDSLRTRSQLALGILMLGIAGPAAAQSITINRGGGEDLSAINSGDVSLNSTVTNPTVLGGTNNTAGASSAQGASTNYSINDASFDAKGNPTGSYTASVSDVRASGINTGTVSVKGTITGGTFNGNNASQSITATGLSNVISIKTSGK